MPVLYILQFFNYLFNTVPIYQSTECRIESTIRCLPGYHPEFKG